MKFDMKTFKVLLAFVIGIGAIFWVMNTTSANTYDGENLDFAVGSGTITITNPSEESLPVQFASPSSRSFRVTSTVSGVSGSSVRQDGDSGISQLFEFGLPPGTNEFTITRGSDVSFVADTTEMLQAIVDPMGSGTSSMLQIGTLLLVIGLLYYASNVNDHEWIASLRARAFPTNQQDTDTATNQEPEPTPLVKDNGQGRALRSYGDNRADIDK